MPCYHPLEAYRSTVSHPRTGKRGLAFSKSSGYSDLPVVVACGQCIGCRLARSRQWAVRIMHEAQMHEANCFVTLTYDEEHLPSPPSLRKEDFQRFMKRVRKWRAPGRVRFFHCGEYGELMRRPHYHAILFGVDFADKIFWKEGGSGKSSFTSATLSELWPYGFATVGAVDFESAAYCARYVVKKVTGDRAASHYEYVDPETGEVCALAAEYITMSLKPGVGATWLEEFHSDVFPEGKVVMRGHEQGAPRYYDKLFELEEPKLYRRMKRARLRAGLRYREDQTPERLAVREKVKVAQVGMLKRKLEES